MLNILGTPEHQIKEDKGKKNQTAELTIIKHMPQTQETDTGNVTLPHQIDW